MTNTRLTDPEVLEFRYPGPARGLPHPQGFGRPRAMERRRRHLAPSASWRRWNALFCPGTAAFRRWAWPAAGTARSARTTCGARTARIDKLDGCDATVLEAGEAIIIRTPTAGDTARRSRGSGTMIEPAQIAQIEAVERDA